VFPPGTLSPLIRLFHSEETKNATTTHWKVHLGGSLLVGGRCGPGGSPASGGPVYAAREAAEVAFVEDLNGRIVAFSQGKPFLLDVLDTIQDRTQVDLLANSELRVCHYQTRQILTLKGPVRASISRDSVTVENRKAVLAFAGVCSAPVASDFQGGLVARGLKTTPVNNVPAR
jgi:hypothetical protein